MHRNLNPAQQFRFSIRRNAKTKLFNKIRLRVNYDCSSIEEIALNLGIPEAYPHTLRSVIKEGYQMLVYPKSWLTELPKEQEQSAIKEIDSIRNTQTDFWSLFAKQIYLENLTVDQPIIQFLSDFLKINEHQLVANDCKFENKVLNVLELVASITTSHQIKKIILNWVTRISGLPLLLNSSPLQYLQIKQYPNFYHTIEKGLKSYDYFQVCLSCQILSFSLRRASIEDAYQFYTSCSHLMSEIFYKAQMFSHKNISIIGETIIQLSNSYISVVKDYNCLGLALIGAIMINSKVEENIVKGLQIIELCAKTQSQQLVDYLVEDLELHQHKLWENLIGHQLILKSQNLYIRRHAYSLLSKVLSNCCHKNLEFIVTIFQVNPGENILEFLHDTLVNEHDFDIIRSSVTIIWALINQGQRYNTIFQQNYVVQNLMELGSDQAIEKYIKHKDGQIAKKSSQMEQIFRHYRDMD